MAKQRHRRYESCDVLLVLGVPEITKRPNDWRSSTTGGSLSEGRSQIVRHRLDEKLFLVGMEMFSPNAHQDFECYNELFEICDPWTLRRREGAQQQPSPFRSKRE